MRFFALLLVFSASLYGDRFSKIDEQVRVYESLILGDKGEYFVKTDGRRKLRKFESLAKYKAYENTEKDDEYLHLVRGKSGNIEFFVITPISESGDWFYEITHIFDGSGNLLYFRRIFNAFGGCGPGRKDMAVEYYQSGKIEKRKVMLTDLENNPIKNSDCPDVYKYKTPRFKTAAEAQKKYGL